MHPSISVIFTTYNQPLWLHKVLVGFSMQTFTDFEVIIADDGSGPETQQVVDDAKTWATYPIKHVWIEDTGYHKCDILNMAIMQAEADYLVFTDGDCIPRKDYLQVHWDNKSPRRFLSGGAVRLPMGISLALTDEDIRSGRAFDRDELNKLVDGEKVRSLKLSKCPIIPPLMNAVSTVKASWNGNNSSCYKEHILAVNGMDERMKYGGQDRQLGERLTNIGITGKLVRYKATMLHLDHKRGYVTEEGWKFNNQLRKETRSEKVTWSPYGILKVDECPSELKEASLRRKKS